MDVVEGVFFVGGDVGNVAVVGLLEGTAEFCRGDDFSGDFFDDVGAGDVFLRGLRRR